jgi:GNAT superfamily N-acetyltransferase
MTTHAFTIRPARTEQDAETIIELIDGAAEWLRLQDTDQWARPWPHPAGRRQRIIDGLANGGHTWIVEDGDIPVASVSITNKGNGLLWQPGELRTRAVYLHRLVINRKYAGIGLGAAILDWAAHYGRRAYRAKVVRIDVWQDNLRLHDYYRRRGFTPPGGGSEPVIRVADKAEYPAGAVFQRGIPRRKPPHPHIKLRLAEDLPEERPAVLAGRAAKPVFALLMLFAVIGGGSVGSGPPH